MKKTPFGKVLGWIPLVMCLGCATAGKTLSVASPPVPLEKANLEAVLEEQEGLEITWEDAKELRDFYRGGVQKKALAEKKFQEKDYREAMKLYDASDEFFRAVIGHHNEDSAEFPLFEGVSILFFPNLLLADNHAKRGPILRETGHESSSQRKWKQALTFLEKSLKTENTEWGLAVRQEILSLSNPPKN